MKFAEQSWKMLGVQYLYGAIQGGVSLVFAMLLQLLMAIGEESAPCAHCARPSRHRVLHVPHLQRQCAHLHDIATCLSE